MNTAVNLRSLSMLIVHFLQAIQYGSTNIHGGGSDSTNVVFPSEKVCIIKHLSRNNLRQLFFVFTHLVGKC